MAFNWGHKLLLVFAVFGIMMSYLVYRCLHTSFDLVSKDYYKQELQYQQVIDGAGWAGKLSHSVTVEQKDAALLIQFPPEMKNTAISGTILFYCAANAGKDKVIPISTNAAATMEIDHPQLLPGAYTVKITWESGQQAYYSEQYILIH